MILVDTSTWIDHLRNGNDQLKELLNENQVLIHRFIVGELALGSMKNQKEIMILLSELPEAVDAEHNEVLQLIVDNNLQGTGIGWVDAHLIASALISEAKLLTMDKPLFKVAKLLGIAE
jgi:predicted nucleic acid-binding protein